MGSLLTTASPRNTSATRSITCRGRPACRTEFTHSLEREVSPPGGTLSADFATPQQGDFLWSTRGMDPVPGNVLAARSGLKTQEEYADLLAISAANLDRQTGRAWRSTEDTAIASAICESMVRRGQLAAPQERPG